MQNLLTAADAILACEHGATIEVWRHDSAKGTRVNWCCYCGCLVDGRIVSRAANVNMLLGLIRVESDKGGA
jgi:hypothetical protein